MLSFTDTVSSVLTVTSFLAGTLWIFVELRRVHVSTEERLALWGAAQKVMTRIAMFTAVVNLVLFFVYHNRDALEISQIATHLAVLIFQIRATQLMIRFIKSHKEYAPSEAMQRT